MIPIRFMIYAGVLASAIAGGWFALNTWHFSPIAKLTKEVSSLEEQMAEVGRQLNVCEANLSKQALQGYIDGVGNEITNEEPIIDFDNITF